MKGSQKAAKTIRSIIVPPAPKRIGTLVPVVVKVA